jgi:hypothetical protein
VTRSHLVVPPYLLLPHHFLLISFARCSGISLLGDIISNKSLAAVSTFPELWAHLYHNPLICLTIGDHLSCWNVGEIRSKNLSRQFASRKYESGRREGLTSWPDRTVTTRNTFLLYGKQPVKRPWYDLMIPL